jgi:PAS domain S-box-containing protein
MASFSGIAPPSERHRTRVLLVDDDPDICFLMKYALLRDAPHFEITTLTSATACLEYLKENPVDCVLSDYQMPEMNGLELLRHLREQGAQVPFIFITCQGNEEVAREAFKSGAYDYFTKDVGMVHFARIVNSIEQGVDFMLAKDFMATAEKSLRQEKEKLQTILASIGEGISIQDRDLRILYQNDASRRLLGDHVGEVCYRAYGEREDACPACPLVQSLQDGAVHTDQRQATRNGEQRYYQITASPLRSSEGEIMGGIEVVRDVTSQHHAEMALRKSKEMLSSIVEAIQFGIVIVGRDRIIRQANPAALAMMGLDSPREVVGRPCHQTICPAEEGKCPILDQGQQVDFSPRFLLDREGNRIPILKSVSQITFNDEEVLLETFVRLSQVKP